MILAIVKGNIVSTNKTEKLVGSKLLIVEEWNIDTNKASGQPLVAMDLVGAGAGELVMCVKGSSARQTEQTDKRPVDMAIIGIVDQAEMDGSVRYRKYPSADETAKPAAKPEKPAAPAPKAEKPAHKPAAPAPKAEKPAAPAVPSSEQFDKSTRDVEIAAERFRKIVSDSNGALKSVSAPHAKKTSDPATQPKE